MINGIENWFPWEPIERETVERRIFKGMDPRLEYDRAYDLTVARASNAERGPVDISVHLDLQKRVYKHYQDGRSFESEWVKADV